MKTAYAKKKTQARGRLSQKHLFSEELVLQNRQSQHFDARTIEIRTCRKLGVDFHEFELIRSSHLLVKEAFMKFRIRVFAVLLVGVFLWTGFTVWKLNSLSDSV